MSLLGCSSFGEPGRPFFLEKPIPFLRKERARRKSPSPTRQNLLPPISRMSSEDFTLPIERNKCHRAKAQSIRAPGNGIQNNLEVTFQSCSGVDLDPSLTQSAKAKKVSLFIAASQACRNKPSPPKQAELLFRRTPNPR
jgi:hypothetical protein